MPKTVIMRCSCECLVDTGAAGRGRVAGGAKKGDRIAGNMERCSWTVEARTIVAESLVKLSKDSRRGPADVAMTSSNCLPVNSAV